MLATAVMLICLPLSQIPGDTAGSMSREAIAHEVKIDQDIGATLHIEPSDTPRAGEKSTAWFALTQRGGQTIPLAACDCKLAVYSQPNTATPVLSPPLTPINAEGYQDIPGATFAFPKVGAYRLVLSGQPPAKPPNAEEIGFAPFELDFDVTVAAGDPAPGPSTDDTAASLAPDRQIQNNQIQSGQTQSSQTERLSSGIAPKGIAVVVGVIVVIGLVRLLVWKSRHKS